MKICAIVAMSENRVIGVKGKLPWHIPEDLKRFSQLTTGHYVLMGRKTWDSLPEKFKPLPKRKNIIISRSFADNNPYKEIAEWNCLEKALEFYKKNKDQRTLWIIGGGEIYSKSLVFWDDLYLTIVPGNYEGDANMPEFERFFRLHSSEDLIADGIKKCTFNHYKKIG